VLTIFASEELEVPVMLATIANRRRSAGKDGPSNPACTQFVQSHILILNTTDISITSKALQEGKEVTCQIDKGRELDSIIRGSEKYLPRTQHNMRCHIYGVAALINDIHF